MIVPVTAPAPEPPVLMALPTAWPLPPMQPRWERTSVFLIVTLLALTAMHPSIHLLSMTVPGTVTVTSPTMCWSGDWPATIWASVQPGTPVWLAQQDSASGVSGQGTLPVGWVGGLVVVVVGALVV